MPDDDVRERVARLESQMAWVEKTLTRIDNDIGTINSRVNAVMNNELKHITDRLSNIEGSTKTGITGADWAKILIAIIGGIGAALVAFIGILR